MVRTPPPEIGFFVLNHIRMSDSLSIRILEEDANRRGDLFGRLMSDLFVSLGYDDVRVNIARSGREIDIEAEHRLEKRLAIAECKALKDVVGGKDLNTLAGKLRAERSKHPGVEITPYFVSLSGFTETAADQESESGREAIILVGGQGVINELIKGRILVPLEQATEKAGQLAAGRRRLRLDAQPELLAHNRGWLWAIYYTEGKQRTHFALVHADGTPLSAVLAREVAEADRAVGGSLHSLTCLNPEPVAEPAAEQLASEAIADYYRFLATECGYILLDGLPADAEVGSRRLQLENLFVPLRLAVPRDPDGPPASGPGPAEAQPDSQPEAAKTRPVGEVLNECSRLAIVASPGGGKSTLLKRLAVAYADPERRLLAEDRLPARKWLPLLFRCRELRDQARSPFPALLGTLAVRACLGDRTAAFRAVVDAALRNGEVLLMVDGLDEISDPGDRTEFVRNLRTFLGIYPNISLVATSREAGFRHVAGLLATVCTCMRVADFSPDDIRSLTVAWHRHVVGDRPDIIADAERLATAIIENDRIRRLAVNPLMLTTLLLVKRWVGQLPTRRSVLYGKAVEVLLMTWNVEGYDPIDQDEALPQLCYVACDMMQRSTQKISRPDLMRLLGKARKELSAELSFARIPVAEFVSRVELRSSLLMMSGHDVVDGTLTEFYEFRHLTFQEYLTAKGFVEGWYPNRKETDTIVSLLEPHFEDEQWREVIPLGAVLAGRKADPLIAKLAERVVSPARSEDDVQHRRLGRGRPTLTALGNCLADEVQATPETLRQGVRVLVSYGEGLDFQPFTPNLARGKYGTIVREEALKAFMAGDPDFAGPGSVLGTSVFHLLLPSVAPNFEPAKKELTRLLASEDPGQRCQGALGTMTVAFELVQRRDAGQSHNWVSECTDALLPLLFSEDPPEQFAACWALAWIGPLNVWFPTEGLLVRLLSLWWGSTVPEIRRLAAWAFKDLPLLPRDPQPLRGFGGKAESLVSMVRNSLEKPKSREAEAATLVAAYYLRSPWTDAELLRLVKENRSANLAADSPRLAEVAAALGVSAEVPARRRRNRKRPTDRPRK
jgi:hypothetical protein